jgi:predicted DNA-binding transcriptional regulator AlpA
MGEVTMRTALNSSMIYELVRKGEFPKWAELPKIACGWHRSEVERWIELRESQPE